MNRHTPWPLVTVLTAVLVAGLLSACVAPTQRVPSQLPPSVPITFEAQGRLLQDARSLLTRGKLPGAARLLTRLIATYPDSVLLPEARWLLARCYEQAGQLPRAIAQYEFVAQATGSPYTEEAVRRVTELRTRVQNHALAPRVTNGWLLTADTLPTEQQFERLAAAGVTLLVIPVGSAEGVYFQTTLAPVPEERVTRLAAAAHRHDILVYAAVSLDQMEWVSRSLGWHDVRYDVALGRLEPSAHLDLFNPAFQEYLSALVADLAGSGVDGLLFRSAPARLHDGLSSFATEAFKREFHVLVDPATLLMSVSGASHRNGHGSPRASVSPGNNLANGPGNTRANAKVGTKSPGGVGATGPSKFAERAELVEPAPVFWQWVGWKARSRAKLLDRVMEASRRTAPNVRFAIELHRESVTEPVKALAQYGEDLLAINQTPADFFFFRFNSGASPNGRSRPPSALDQTRSFLQRTSDLLGGLDRVWLASASASNGTQALRSLDPVGDRMGLPGEIGLVYEGRAL